MQDNKDMSIENKILFYYYFYNFIRVKWRKG